MNLFKILRSLKLILSVFNQIYEAIEKEGLQFSKLNTIIFTHQDIDHIGNVCDILKKVPEGIKTFSHEEEKVYINGERTPVKLAKLQSNLDSRINGNTRIELYKQIILKNKNNIKKVCGDTLLEKYPNINNIIS